VSDEDEMDDLLNAMRSDDGESSSEEAESDDSDLEDSDMDDSDLEDSNVQDSNNDETVEESTMNGDDDSMGDEGGGITQAEVYENLKRIGELEDEKQKIQDELRERTEQLRSMLKHIDRGSILYKMLQSALADSASKSAAARPTKKSAAKSAPKTSAKKATKKKGRK
jgi:hypothetical protein